MTIRRRQPPAAGVVIAAPAGNPPLGGAVTAAAGHTYESNRNDGLPDFALTQQQIEIDRFVDCVGWAGFYVQIKAMLGAMCPWIVEHREGTDWVPVRDPRINALASLIQPPARSQTGLRFRSLMLQASIAEHAFWPATTPDRGLVFDIAHPGQLRRSRDSIDRFVVRTRSDARVGGPGWHEYGIERLRRHWIPNRRWTDEADPELATVLTELRLYESTVLDLLRSSQSRMVMNGLLYIPTMPTGGNVDGGTWATEQSTGVADPGSAVPPTPAGGSLSKLIADMSAFGARAYRDHMGNDVASAMPYPFPHFAEPKMLDLGRPMSSEALAALAEIVFAAARGLHIPSQFLVSGEASANHWGDAELRRALHERAVFPELEPNNEFWTDVGLRPIMEVTRAGGLVLRDDDPADYRLGCDTSVLDVKSDSLQAIALAHSTGAAGRAWLASKLGIPEGEMLRLPSDVTEYEQWLYSKSSSARASGEAARDGLTPSSTPGPQAGDEPGAGLVPSVDAPAEPEVTAGALRLIAGGRR